METDVKPDDNQGVLDVAISWLIYIVMCTLGALANYADKVEKGEKFSIKTFILRWLTAAFAASMAALYGESQLWDQRFIYMVCGVSGYMGVKAINIGEGLIRSKFSFTQEKKDENSNGN